jgi:polar amino acid transport system substrate-binding protein
MNRRVLAAALGGALLMLVTACGTNEAVSPGPAKAVVPKPAGATVLTEPPSAAPAPDCANPTWSLRPQATAGPTVARIRARGKLVVGVDQNTYHFGYRNPATGNIEGFDIDMAKEIARAIFGTPDKLQLRILTSKQRIPALKAHQVDIVIRTMTITCDRLEDVDFSSVYYQASQRVLVRSSSRATGMNDLGGKKVCATEGSTSLTKIAAATSRPVPVQVPNWTDCLVMLQQHQIDAISTDDTILGGLKAQDPFTEIVGEPIEQEPYGMAMPKGETDFVRFVNNVIQKVRTDGTWQASYDRWLAHLLGPAAALPATKYRD